MAKQIGTIEIPVYEYEAGNPNLPAYSGKGKEDNKGIAVWGAQSKDKQHLYLSIKIEGEEKARAAFKNTPKEKPKA